MPGDRNASDTSDEQQKLQPRHRVSHSILTAAWHMLTTGELYRDLGGDYFIRQNPDRLTKRLIRQLEALGHQVTLAPKHDPQEIAT